MRIVQVVTAIAMFAASAGQVHAAMSCGSSFGGTSWLSYESFWGCNNTCTEWVLSNRGSYPIYVQINGAGFGFVNTVIQAGGSDVLYTPANGARVTIECSIWE